MTPEQVALLKGEIAKAAYEDKTPREIARMLSNRGLVPNPSPQPQVPRPLYAADAVALNLSGISDEILARLHQIIQDQDNAALADLAKIMERGGLIPADISTQIQGYANGTVADPAWASEVPGNSLLMALGIRTLEWGGMTFTDSIPRGAVEDVQNG